MNKKISKKALIVFFIILSFGLPAPSQPIKIGDPLPDVTLHNIINYPTSTASLKDFNKKPLLIQFWFAECSVCMGMFKRLDTLQHQFSGKVQFLLVTLNSTAQTKQLFSTHPVVSKIKIPCVTGDTILKSTYFPHFTQPHEIWVGADGIVKAITTNEEVNARNLGFLASGAKLSLNEKKDASDVSEFYALQPLITYQYEMYKKDLLYYSFITGARDGLSGATTMPFAKDSIKRLISVNDKLEWLYIIAFNKQGLHKTRIFMKYPPGVSSESRYCYDLIMKTASREAVFARMREDLDRQFGLHSRIEKRNMPCYVLQQDTTRKILPSQFKTTKTYDSSNYKVCHHITIANLLNNVDRQDLPIIDESGYKKSIDIILPSTITDIPLLKKAFSAAGLQLIKTSRPIDVIVVD